MTSFDSLFRRVITTQSFVRGWGNPLHLQELCANRRERVAIRSECMKLVPAESVQENTVQIVKQETRGNRLILDAKFPSPLAFHFPHLVRVNLFLFYANECVFLFPIGSTRSGYSTFSTRLTT